MLMHPTAFFTVTFRALLTMPAGAQFDHSHYQLNSFGAFVSGREFAFPGNTFDIARACKLRAAFPLSRSGCPIAQYLKAVRRQTREWSSSSENTARSVRSRIPFPGNGDRCQQRRGSNVSTVQSNPASDADATIRREGRRAGPRPFRGGAAHRSPP